MAEYSKIPHVIIEVVEGLIQGVYADGPVGVDVFDFDTDDPDAYDAVKAAWDETFDSGKYDRVW